MDEIDYGGTVEPPRNATREEVPAALAGRPFREGVVYPLIGDEGYVYPDGTTVEFAHRCADTEIPQGGTVEDYPCGMLCTEPLDRATGGMVRVGDCTLGHGHDGDHDPFPPRPADYPDYPVGALAAYRYAARALRTEQARRFLPAALGRHGATYAAGWDAAADWLLHIALPLTEGGGK